MRTALSRDDLLAAQASGLYRAKAAEHYNVSTATIDRAERREGIKLARSVRGETGFDRDHRDAVQDMQPLEAVEYLLEVIEALRAPVHHEWQLPGVHLTRSERQIVYALVTSGPRILTRSRAMDALMFGREADDPPQDKIVDVFVSRLRQKLSGCGITITTHWGQGWTISAPDGFVWPWCRP